MKKYILPIMFILIFLSCDDGNLVVQTIDFTDLPITKCGEKDVLYKLKDSEILFLEMPLSNLPVDATPVNTPTNILISASNKIVYRLYDGTISSDNICPTVQAASPNLKEQWTTTSGTIAITTTANVVPNPAIDSPNATKIDKYNHSITLKNVVFAKPNGDQFYETYEFGTYQTDAVTLPFSFDDQIAKSSCDNRIFNFSGSAAGGTEALILDLADYGTLIQSSATTTPRTALISSTNKLTYSIYNGTVNDAYFCTNLTSPTVAQTWTALDGVIAVSGIIEVETTSFGTGFQHTIHLKKIILKRGNSQFTLGDDYIYGSFITN
jgi:hypothetical protein